MPKFTDWHIFIKSRLMQYISLFELESYDQHEHHLPSEGKFIIAQYDQRTVIVYQAFKQSIADYAIEHQKFGGPDYDFNRMTWLKPSFLWMMYYSGWAKKENQENVLAIRMKREGFDEILNYAVMTSFDNEIYSDNDAWQQQLEDSDVQLQWEPYHDLFGNKTDRKAVKIGLKGKIQRKFNENWIEEIKNITPYVQKQQFLMLTHHPEMMELPHERVYTPDDLNILKKIDATDISL